MGVGVGSSSHKTEVYIRYIWLYCRSLMSINLSVFDSCAPVTHDVPRCHVSDGMVSDDEPIQYNALQKKSVFFCIDVLHRYLMFYVANSPFAHLLLIPKQRLSDVHGGNERSARKF